MANTHKNLVIEFEDQYGIKRVIRGDRRGLHMQQVNGQTLSQALSVAVGRIVGEKVRAARLAKKMGPTELCRKAQLTAAKHPKHRIYEIEKSIRPHGVRIGTLYAIAKALDIEATELLPTMKELTKESGMTLVNVPTLVVPLQTPKEDIKEHVTSVRVVNSK